MPMVLRSRKSINPGQASEAESLDTPRRSTRLQRRATYEDSDDSDSESVQRRAVMEIHRGGAPVVLEEETAEEAADVTELKYCHVVLDRLHIEDKQGQKELEEKEDMSRKVGKTTSRIPTFHKRPTSHGAELPAPRRETSVLPAQSNDKAGSSGVEASRSKPPEARETALPQLSSRLAKYTAEDPPVPSGSEQAAAVHSPPIAAPRSWSPSESMLSPLMTASPRPALIRDRGPEADVGSDAPWSHVPHEGSASRLLFEDLGSRLPDEGSPRHKPRETTPQRDQGPPESSFSYISGDYNRSPTVPAAQEDQEEEEEEEEEVEAIMDEEPPWKTESMKVADLRVSRSSSEAECEEEEEEEVEEMEEQPQEPLMSPFTSLREKRVEADKSCSAVASEKPEKASSANSDKRSGCSGFALLFLLPATLLLLGGFGLHVWHYGLPMSVAQLTAQLELHWLEGLGLIPEPCSTDCRVHLVESVPVGLYESSPPPRRSIADSWLRLLQRANSSVDIAAFYFTLRASDTDLGGSADAQGREVFQQLKQLHARGVKLQIAVNSPQKSIRDTGELAAAGAEVREVDLQVVTGGIVHTKLWVVDQKHLYVGSANMDWRSLTEVKEVGVSVEDCSCLAQDAFRIFGVYWSLGGVNHTSLPPYWPARLSALSSSQNPLRLKLNGVPARAYLSSSPPQISARGRADDLSSILSVIDDAHNFIYISVMDYLPLSQYTQPVRFWPAIDSALRAAACTRGVHVRLLVSCWEHSPGSMFTFLRSLLVLSSPPLSCHISVNVFTVPSTAEQKKIPYARVNHAKYMVTDRALYIGTSNWSENYFTQTAGVGLVVNQTGSAVGPGQQTLQSQAEDLFLRDWSSPYSSPLSVDDQHPCAQ
ncbi:phospholipase D3-like isoform X1 [Salarias fasciatus]|uniref:Phospholipase D3-like n=2 Tax=Salarias fasciatus TaxID=181472 RepID=A0A672G1L8_SALFA|nr:phospholipase D3-like isoform X1 [Salarias fasciatus]XP_029972659.1 phospholipase D3-like isoform X1 [Salarias fasciatus]